ncbi:MAG: chemotaxis protein CheA, partial [Desulfovibrio sp.]
MSPDNGALDMVREEVAELLTEMESALLALEGDPGETRLINRIFRAVHTIKGAANMFEFREAAGLAHELENLLDLVRQGVMEVHKGFLEACLQAKDILWPLFQRPVSEASQEAAQGLLGVLRQVTSTPSPPSEPSESSEPAPGSDLPGPAPAPSGLERFHIEFKLKGEDVLVHIDPKAILDELRGLGRVVVRADAGELSDLDALAPESCVLGWEIELDTDAGEDAVRDVFIFAEEYAEFAISWAVETPAPEEAREPLAVAPATPVEQELEPEQEGPGLADEDPDPWSSLKTDPQRPGTQDNEEPQAGVRVDAAKLDDLVALVGELVIAQAQLGIVAARLS